MSECPRNDFLNFYKQTIADLLTEKFLNENKEYERNLKAILKGGGIVNHEIVEESFKDVEKIINSIIKKNTIDYNSARQKEVLRYFKDLRNKCLIRGHNKD